MNQNGIEKLKAELAQLPKGYISNKTINGIERHYLQWRENGKTKSKYIPDSEYEAVAAAVARRKEIEQLLKSADIRRAAISPAPIIAGYEMNVITGDALRAMVSYVAGWQKRDCFRSILAYLNGKATPRVCAVYGLRRTGKTTMLHQAINEMKPEMFSQAAYIKARKKQTMSQLDRDLKQLFNRGFRYVFIDEITFLEDFVDTASFLSDIYAAMGMKIVLSGTDSLGIWIAEKEELYDRAYLIHTTWISYAEHARLLGSSDVDDYIRYGGTLRVGETDFDDPELRSEEVSFRDDESTRRYIDTAICGNIQHSLKCYEDGAHFRHLRELYDAGELTGAINRIIESMNHRFVAEVLNREFVSNDLKLSRKNLLRERNAALRTDVLERIDVRTVTDRLMEILEIEDKQNRSVPIQPAHVAEIKEYLSALELIASLPVKYTAPESDDRESILITQPGMRYCQAQALVYSLGKDEIFAALNEAEREYVCSRILDEVKGRMLEEIVLYETMRKLPECDVFKLEFIAGEFDMVIYDRRAHSCKIFEIKHSRERVDSQYRHLINEAYCRDTAKQFGTITEKTVLYRGEPHDEPSGIRYQNVSEYLRSL